MTVGLQTQMNPNYLHAVETRPSQGDMSGRAVRVVDAGANVAHLYDPESVQIKPGLLGRIKVAVLQECDMIKMWFKILLGIEPHADKSPPTVSGVCASEGRLPRAVFDVKSMGVSEDNIHKLAEHISALKSALISDAWRDSGESFVGFDWLVMPDLVSMANTKKPGLNLAYLEHPSRTSVLKFPANVSEAIKKALGTSDSARFIVDLGPHFAAMDCQVVEGRISVILFESSQFCRWWASSPVNLFYRYIEEDKETDFIFSVVEMDIQRSGSECGIFSLALGKKIHKERETLLSLHALNVKGELPVETYMGVPYVPSRDADRYLTPNFYKHTQGRARIRNYLESKPEAEHAKINKRQQTLPERSNESIKAVGNAMISQSIHTKRLYEYESLMAFYLQSMPSTEAVLPR